MNKLMKLTAMTVLSLSLVSTAQALTLDEARAKKQVDELPTGYVKANDEKVKAFVDEINAKRRAAYEDIAKKNGLTVDQVAAQAAKKIQEKKN